MRRLLSNRKFAAGMIISIAFLVVALIGPWFVANIMQVNPRGIDYEAISAPPSAQHLLGTNHVGQDVLAQLIIGARGSVTVGLLSGIIATVIAVLVGTTAGYLGGVPDRIINAVVNVLMTLPGFALLFIIAGYVQEAGILLIAVVIGLLEWPGGARSIRAQTMSLRDRDFTSALRTVGESTPRIIAVEVVPHLGGVISSMFLKAVVAGIFMEASLAFLGLGSTSEITWGTMVSQAQTGGAILRGHWWFFLPPGLAIALIGFATAMINFGLDEITNPQLNARLNARTRQFNREQRRRRALTKAGATA